MRKILLLLFLSLVSCSMAADRKLSSYLESTNLGPTDFLPFIKDYGAGFLSNAIVKYKEFRTVYSAPVLASVSQATNYVILADQRDNTISAATTNVYILAAMGDFNNNYEWNLIITNGTAYDKSIDFSYQTNNWIPSFENGVVMPSVLTNYQALHLFARQYGTNVIVRYHYTPWNLPPAPTVDAYWRGQTAAIGIMDTNRFYAGLITNGNFGVYSNTPSPTIQSIYVSNDFTWPLLAQIRVGNQTYGNTPAIASNNVSFKDLPTNSVFNDFRYYFATNQNQVMVGFFFQLMPSEFVNDFMDVCQFDGTSSDYAVFSVETANPPVCRVHSNTNGGSIGPNITISSNHIYWVQLSWDTNTDVAPTGQAMVQVFNGTNGAFIGRSVLGHSTAGSQALYTRIGKENHIYTRTNSYRIKDIIWRFNRGTAGTTNYLWATGN